jgi:hypothetical protein
MSLGRILRVDDSQSHLIGMARIDGSNVSVLSPQQEPGFTIVKSVANEYVHPSNGSAAPPAPADARTAIASATPTAFGSARTLKSFSDAGAVVYDPDLHSDITIAPDGMSGTYILQAQGYPPTKTTIEYEGGEHPASAAKKVGKLSKGIGTLFAQGLNHNPNAGVNVDNDPDKSWRIKAQGADGKALMFESGGFRVGGMTYSGKDPFKMQSLKNLQAFKLDLETLEAAVKSGQPVKFDLSSERSQRGWNALVAATKAYDLK